MSRVAYIFLSIVVAHVCAAPNSLECPANSKHSQCAGLCPRTCKKQEKIICNPINPKETCKPGCECIEGYVKNEESGECVLPSNCPQAITTHEPMTEEPTTQEPSTCEANEEIGCKYCEPNCDNPNSSRCSSIFCFRKSCTCASGYLRDLESRKCVPAGKCPNKKCKAGEILAPCARSCEDTCLGLSKPFGCSPVFCFSSSCQCDHASGYVRDLSTQECVLESQCS